MIAQREKKTEKLAAKEAEKVAKKEARSAKTEMNKINRKTTFANITVESVEDEEERIRKHVDTMS